MEAIMNFIHQTGFYLFAQGDNWKCLVMIAIACVLLFLGIVKKFEPLLLVPIAFGMLITNLPGAEMYHEILFAGGHVHWDLFGGTPITQEFLTQMANAGVSEAVLSAVSVGQSVSVGLVDILYLGIKLGIYPCLIFLGVGAMTDFGPLIANPKSLLLGAAAQVGIFLTYAGCRFMGFTGAEAGSIGIIGGADGPTAIFVTAMLAPALLGPIAVAAYSSMALVPVIQPPIMKLLTTEKERQIVMKPLRQVSKKEKIIFPIVVTIFVALLVPSAGPLIACLMLGNLFRECGVTERLSKTVQNELINIVTIFLGVSVGATATGATFLSLQTIKIMVMGIVAFGCGTAGGVLLAKFMNLFLKEKIIFPVVVTIFVALLVPSAAPLIACLMLGNLFKECGVTERLSKTVQNELMNIVTIFLGVSVGATATGATFLNPKTLMIMGMGIVAFGFGTAGGVLLAKFMNLFLKEKINPLIGSAGVSAVPMAARVSQKVGQEANPGNFLLMHAMGPNVAGVIGSAIAAGVLISLFG